MNESAYQSRCVDALLYGIIASLHQKSTRCIICGRPHLTDGLTCTRSICKKATLRYEQHLAWQDTKDRIIGILKAFWQHACFDDLPLYQQIFYTFKGIICAAINRRLDLDWDKKSGVKVSEIYYRGNECRWEAMWLCVHRGVFTNWGFYKEDDGSAYYKMDQQ